MKNKNKLIEIICPNTQIRTLVTYNELCNYAPLTMKEIMEEEGELDAYVCQVQGYDYSSFKNKFVDEPWLNPFDEFLDKLKAHNEYEKVFGDFHVIMTGES
jgi:hypothetical protein